MLCTTAVACVRRLLSLTLALQLSPQQGADGDMDGSYSPLSSFCFPPCARGHRLSTRRFTSASTIVPSLSARTSAPNSDTSS